MGAVFLKNDEKILYLISGDNEKIHGCKCSGFEVLDAENRRGQEKSICRWQKRKEIKLS